MSTSEPKTHDFRHRRLITHSGGITARHCWIRKRNSSLTNHSLLALALLVISNNVEITALPFPPPDLSLCGTAFNTTEGCCTLPLRNSTQPLEKYTLQHAHLPLRTRRPAHFLDDAYIAKYERAMALMRALPETDGRSFTAQYRLHCAYCNNHLFYPNHEYPLEIHQSWLFLPWHRIFLFFHERILASFINDDTFALQFWNWDSQNATAPFPNALPRVYYKFSVTLDCWLSLIL